MAGIDAQRNTVQTPYRIPRAHGQQATAVLAPVAHGVGGNTASGAATGSATAGGVVQINDR